MRDKQNLFARGELRKRRPRRWLLALAAAGVSLAVNESVQASTVSWAVDASGDWSTPSNWSTNRLPGPADDVIFNRSSNAYTVTLSYGNQTINSFTNLDENFARRLSVTSRTGTLEVSSSATLIDSGLLTGSSSLTLSGTAGTAGGGGMLNITSAEAFSGSLTIDGSSASAGAFDTTLLLSGAGTMDNLSVISLVRQGTLELYDASGLTSGRLGHSAQLNCSGGTLSIMGPNGGLANESLGKLDLVQGSSIIDLIDGSSGTVDLTFASYTRTAGAQV